MSGSASREPLAVRIAQGLIERHAGLAAPRAAAIRDRARLAGDIARCDLFVGCCAYLHWHAASPATADAHLMGAHAC